ncbi:hypothetical protein RvY_17063 [Ramazzottius varieornatus]|uniref:Protein kinase domain-containing protein n=1 Tax=Ramazzottius varieornatus TaxID=947166 RepID=A0A1D1W0S4_RAMVA|nr:hypothetical protein RvY_17063 [Ramazzottius varieornatus]
MMLQSLGKSQPQPRLCPFHAQRQVSPLALPPSFPAAKMTESRSSWPKPRNCCISWRTYLQVSADSGRGSSVDEAVGGKGSVCAVASTLSEKREDAPSLEGKSGGTMRRLIRHCVVKDSSIDQPLLAVLGLPPSRKSLFSCGGGDGGGWRNKREAALALLRRTNSTSPSGKQAAFIDRRRTLIRQAATLTAAKAPAAASTRKARRRTASLLLPSSVAAAAAAAAVATIDDEQQANGTLVLAKSQQQQQPFLTHQVPCSSSIPLSPSVASSSSLQLEVSWQKDKSHDLRLDLAGPSTSQPALCSVSSAASSWLLLPHSTAPVATAAAHHLSPTQPAVAPLDRDSGIDLHLPLANPDQVDGSSTSSLDTMRTRPLPLHLDSPPSPTVAAQPEVAAVHLTALTSPHYPCPTLWQRNHQMHRQLSSSSSRNNSQSHLYHSLSQKTSASAEEVRNGVASPAAEEEGYVYLNQYKLSNETLGHGTYSIVKLAYNTQDNTHYAMKILSKKKLMKKHHLTRKTGDPMQEAYREIAILKKLNHPNIIRLIEVLDDPLEDSLYMVFELLERGEVLVIPTDNPLPEGMVWSLFRELILGVEYLHYNGILHRDLKPSNLLLDDSGHLKIADFGLSHMFEGSDQLLSGTVGTPAFHAPEIISAVTSSSSPSADPTARATSRPASLTRTGSDSSDQDGPSLDLRLPRPNRTVNKVLCSGVAMDIWSMGVTLFSLVFGEVPFRDQFIVGLYHQIKTAPPHFPYHIVISDALQHLILGLLEKEPSKRMTIAEMRLDEWVTRGDTCPLLPSKADNCRVHIDVTEGDILSSVLSIPHLDTLILIKAMLKRGSFHHPFKATSEPSSAHSLPDSSTALVPSTSAPRPTASILS